MLRLIFLHNFLNFSLEIFSDNVNDFFLEKVYDMEMQELKYFDLGGHAMEHVLKRLSEIESAASSVMDSVEEKKKELSLAMEAKIRDFDEAVEKETAHTIEELRTQLLEQISLDLKEQEKQTDMVLQALEKEYEEDHIQLAQTIFQSIIH